MYLSYLLGAMEGKMSLPCGIHIINLASRKRQGWSFEVGGGIESHNVIKLHCTYIASILYINMYAALYMGYTTTGISWTPWLWACKNVKAFNSVVTASAGTHIRTYVHVGHRDKIIPSKCAMQCSTIDVSHSSSLICSSPHQLLHTNVRHHAAQLALL